MMQLAHCILSIMHAKQWCVGRWCIPVMHF